MLGKVREVIARVETEVDTGDSSHSVNELLGEVMKIRKGTNAS